MPQAPRGIIPPASLAPAPPPGVRNQVICRRTPATPVTGKQMSDAKPATAASGPLPGGIRLPRQPSRTRRPPRRSCAWQGSAGGAATGPSATGLADTASRGLAHGHGQPTWPCSSQALVSLSRPSPARTRTRPSTAARVAPLGESRRPSCGRGGLGNELCPSRMPAARHRLASLAWRSGGATSGALASFDQVLRAVVHLVVDTVRLHLVS
jgi:ribosomal protein L32